MQITNNNMRFEACNTVSSLVLPTDPKQLRGARVPREASHPTTYPTTTTRWRDKFTLFPKLSTVTPVVTTPSSQDAGLKPDLLSIIVVTCVFVVGLSVCLFVGCRSKNPDPEPSTSQEVQGLTGRYLMCVYNTGDSQQPLTSPSTIIFRIYCIYFMGFCLLTSVSLI